MVSRFILLLAGALLLMPFGVAAQTSKSYDFPQEALTLRLSAIIKTYKVDITYNEVQLKNIIVPALKADPSSAEKTLSQSLASTEFTYKKLTDKSFVINKSTNKKKGTITGTVLDKTGFPIPGATIFIVGTNNGTATDIKGNFILKDVPARNISVEVSCISYAKMRVSDINVAPGQSKPLDVVLQDDTEQLEEVVVTATYNKASAKGLYAKQKAMVALSDGVSADLIKKTADNNVAQVLKRVSGVTIDKGKYVTVRGMGERYNNVQLNGSSLPSTEPNRRNFSFDVIPSSLIDNVTIAKTFTPDLPGEFTGGLVEVNTLAVPDKKFLSISIGTGMNTQTTGKDFLTTERFKSDWFFGEIDKRQWFAGREGDAVKTNLQNAGKRNGYGLGKMTATPVQNYNLTIGLPIDLGYEQKLGIVAGLTYRNEQLTEEIKEGRMMTKDSLYLPGHRYKFATSTGAVGNIGWEMPGHKITWRNLFNNRFTHTNQERYVYKYYDDKRQYEQYSVPLISRLIQTQLDGEHKLFDERLIFDWNASYNKVKRTNPDDGLITGIEEAKTTDEKSLINWGLAVDNSNDMAINDSHRMYSNLEETKKNIGANLTFPFEVQGNQQRIKTGYLGTFRTSDFQQQYIKAKVTDSFDRNTMIGLPINEFFAPDKFVEGGQLQYVSSGMQGNKADFYEGDQKIHALYLMGEFTFFRKLHLTTGFRMEDANTELHTTIWNREEQRNVDSIATLKKTDWLPAATLVYNITDNINARFAYSRTIARPDFRELSPCSYYNVDDRIWVVGTGGIKQSHSDNFDLRFEWYPQAGEVFSIGGFYKKFKEPVEMVTRKRDDQAYNLYPFNLDEASVMGLELNLRKSLGFIAPGSFLKDLYISGNTTLIKGDVSYNYERLLNSTLGEETADIKSGDRKRPLQGLAPYTVNAGLTYQGKIIGAALSYGRVGRTLVLAGIYDKYDQYENSRNVLDLQVSARFLKECLEVKFNASDMLNEDIIIYQNCMSGGTEEEKQQEPDGVFPSRTQLGMNYNEGDWILSRIKKGINLSMSISYRF